MQPIIFFDFTSETPTAGWGRNGKYFFLKSRNRDGVALFQKIFKKMPAKPAGVVAVVGPGRFSAVRGGVLAANMLAEFLNIPAAGVIKKTDESSEELVRRGAASLSKKKRKTFILPHYGAPPNITAPARACSREAN